MLRDETLKHTARALGDSILSSARPLGDGSLTWGRDTNLRSEPTLDAGLFEGRIGEALLFAALARTLGQSRFADAAELTIGPLRQRLRIASECEAIVTQNGFGLLGLGSMIYALVRIAAYLDSAHILEDARRAVRNLTAGTIQSDDRFEFFRGVAGLILGLVAVADTGDAVALDRAQECGVHLLSHRVADSVSGFRGWPTCEGSPSAGFAHGCSGIAHSLLQLDRRTSDHGGTEAAMEAFAFERALFEQHGTEWPDIRHQEGPLMCSWCHGAPGIGISRLSALHAGFDEPGIRSDLRLTLQQTSEFWPSADLDILCCGSLGRADFVLEAGRLLGDEQLVSLARRMVDRVVSRATSTGSFLLPVDGERHLEPGMWQGTTGIAFSLLRMADPDAHPCILLLSSR